MSPTRKALSHVSQKGEARMVDVSEKAPGPRSARARAFVSMSEEALESVSSGGLFKGDALSTARIAGIMAAKRTHELIPLCHPLAITDVKVDLSVERGGVEIITEVKTTDRTGVEMEALTAASVAALTVYDMCKAVDKSISIETVQLLSKTGGKSGNWKRGA